VDPLIKPHKNLHVYEMLVGLVDAEEQSTNQIRASEEEVLLTVDFLLFSCYLLSTIYVGKVESQLFITLKSGEVARKS